jgi:hypothetical protein
VRISTWSTSEDDNLLLKMHATGRRYHQRFMRSKELQVDDLVLRWMLNWEDMNKLSTCWEGPFRVTQVCRPGCVRLATEKGEPVPCPWNIEHLHKFYA